MNQAKFKPIYLMSLIFLLGFLGLAAWKIFNNQPLPAMAGSPPSGIPIKGYAFFDTVGWLKFWQNGSYGVAADDNGNLMTDSWAWSENVGWVAFFRPQICDNNPARVCSSNADCGAGSCVLATPPIAVTMPSNCSECTGACSACFDRDDHGLNGDRKFYGWAYVLALGNASKSGDGWIKLNGNNGGYYVSAKDEADPNTWGDFVGWAWSGDDNDKSGFGWLSFNCSNRSACTAANNYKVSGRPGRIVLYSARNYGGHTIYLNWSETVSGAQWFDVWRKETVCNGGTRDGQACNENISDLATCGLNSTCSRQIAYRSISEVNDRDATAYSDQNLIPYVPYTYKVKVCNIFACRDSNEVVSVTSRIDDIINFIASPTCDPGGNNPRVDLSWTRPYVYRGDDPLFDIAFYELEYCILDANKNVGNCVWNDAAASIVNSDEAVTYTHNDANSRNNYRIYRVRALANDGNVRKACVSGDNLGMSPCANNANCTINGACLSGENVCDESNSKAGQACADNADCVTAGSCDFEPSSSTWAYSKIFRICAPNSQYEEVRPQ